jgi:hypothetical protein
LPIAARFAAADLIACKPDFLALLRTLYAQTNFACFYYCLQFSDALDCENVSSDFF